MRITQKNRKIVFQMCLPSDDSSIGCNCISKSLRYFKHLYPQRHMAIENPIIIPITIRISNDNTSNSVLVKTGRTKVWGPCVVP